MGLIKEPEGVDFIVNSRPLTKKEKIAISNYIHAYKANQARNLLRKKKKRSVAKRKLKTASKKKAVI